MKKLRTRMYPAISRKALRLLRKLGYNYISEPKDDDKKYPRDILLVKFIKKKQSI